MGIFIGGFLEGFFVFVTFRIGMMLQSAIQEKRYNDYYGKH